MTTRAFISKIILLMIIVYSFSVIGLRIDGTFRNKLGIFNWVAIVNGKFPVGGRPYASFTDIQLAMWAKNAHLDKNAYVLNYGGYFSNWFILSGLDIVFKRGGFFSIESQDKIVEIIENIREGNYQYTPLLLKYNVKYVFISQRYYYVPVNPYLQEIKNHNGSQLYRILDSPIYNQKVYTVPQIERNVKRQGGEIRVERHQKGAKFKRIELLSFNGKDRKRLHLEIDPTILLGKEPIQLPIQLDSYDTANFIAGLGPGRFRFQLIKDGDVIKTYNFRSKKRGLHNVFVFENNNGLKTIDIAIINSHPDQGDIRFWGLKVNTNE